MHVQTAAPDRASYFQVLIVEDTSIETTMIKRWWIPILEKWGGNYTLIFRETCDAGWAYAKENPVNFYVIDGNTPGELQGPRMCQKVIKKFPNAQVVLYSAMREEEIENAQLPKEVKVIGKKIQQLNLTLEEQLGIFTRERNGRKNSANLNGD